MKIRIMKCNKFSFSFFSFFSFFPFFQKYFYTTAYMRDTFKKEEKRKKGKSNKYLLNKHIRGHPMNLCFICLQNTETRLRRTWKQCVCDGYVHTECINEWYNHSANCPICRKATRETAFPEPLPRETMVSRVAIPPKEDINVDAIVYTMFLITVFIIVFIL